MIKKTFRKTHFAPLLFLLSSACTDEGGTAAPTGADEETVRAAVETYGQLVHASYEDSAQSALALEEAIGELIKAPSEKNLEAARDSWLAAREPYLQTEVYRFYGGPIDEEDGPEGLLNAWPLDEVYIDYVEGDLSAGLINDLDADISASSLIDLNEAGGEANIATGYHAIEFLLWGQDLRDDGPGQRPFTDYVQGEQGTAENAARRAEYLGVAAELLTEQLEALTAAWAPGKENFRADFESDNDSQSLGNILTGMIILSGFETGGERLQAALDSGDQEDEHSCFSDNTHRDMIQDVQGVLNVYLGSYTRTDGSHIEGTGIKSVVEGIDPELADELEARMKESLKLAEALETPFDQAIALDNHEGREGVAALITSLREQERLLEDVFRALDLQIPVAE